MKTDVFHLHALSALHVGVGQAVGVVDLPIARAKATNLPLVPGSALKGVLRDEFADHADQALLFGPERIDNPEGAHAGAIAFGDAHLLLLPVRSLAGIMAWATCPFILARYAADLRRAGAAAPPAPPSVSAGRMLAVTKSELHLSSGKAVFEDLDLAIDEGKAEAWARHFADLLFADDGDSARQFPAHFAILSDADFGFLADTATEVRARIRIDDERGTVEKGALWYEENLPSESVLWGVLGIGPGRKPACTAADTHQRFHAGMGKERLLQIGGKATIGRGLVRFITQGKAP
ncbi:MAG: type III-B CRISPR module RAMP protein Cmr4 [Proteobacteria bacterium]|nr:type III-B CRISPR module RAMP protein Cmr4 [Pseudomonadota bacterium]